MIEILGGGTQSTLQDAGRPGHRHLGIPGGGAADRLNFALANYIVGNPWNTTAIECAVGGLHVKFREPVRIALTGAEMWAQINGNRVAEFRTYDVSRGDILTLSYARNGARAYLAVAGGIKAAKFLGSTATYIPAGLGGLDGRALRVGDKLKSAEQAYGPPQKIPQGYAPGLSQHIVLRVRPAAEFNALTPESQRQLFVGLFSADTQTDRMGSRLKYAKEQTDPRGNVQITLSESRSMTSSPLLPGTVQIPPNGQPILVLADGHCTGGYPRALQVIRADLWQTGQIGPGTKVSFRRCFSEDVPSILTSRNAFYAGAYGGLIDGFEF